MTKDNNWSLRAIWIVYNVINLACLWTTTMICSLFTNTPAKMKVIFLILMVCCFKDNNYNTYLLLFLTNQKQKYAMIMRFDPNSKPRTIDEDDILYIRNWFSLVPLTDIGTMRIFIVNLILPLISKGCHTRRQSWR